MIHQNTIKIPKWQTISLKGAGIQNSWSETLQYFVKCTRCPKKNWELLLVIVAVTPTFFWDTLYIVGQSANHSFPELDNQSCRIKAMMLFCSKSFYLYQNQLRPSVFIKVICTTFKTQKIWTLLKSSSF